jgi:hypothetical protein
LSVSFFIYKMKTTIVPIYIPVFLKVEEYKKDYECQSFCSIPDRCEWLNKCENFIITNTSEVRFYVDNRKGKICIIQNHQVLCWISVIVYTEKELDKLHWWKRSWKSSNPSLKRWLSDKHGPHKTYRFFRKLGQPGIHDFSEFNSKGIRDNLLDNG